MLFIYFLVNIHTFIFKVRYIYKITHFQRLHFKLSLFFIPHWKFFEHKTLKYMLKTRKHNVVRKIKLNSSLTILNVSYLMGFLHICNGKQDKK